MKKIIVWIAAALAILLVFGSVFSIDLDKLKDKDSDEPAKTTPPSTTAPEPSREIETSLDNLLKRYKIANRIYPYVEYGGGEETTVFTEIRTMNSTIVDPDLCFSEVDEGMYLDLSNFKASQAGPVFETRSVPYGSDIIVSFSVGHPYFEDFSGGFTFGIRTLHSATFYNLPLLAASNGVYSRLFGYLLLCEVSDTWHKISMHVSLTGGFVDYYVDGVFVCTYDLSLENVDFSSHTVQSGFYIDSIEPNTADYYFDSFTIYVPTSVYGDAMPTSPEAFGDLLDAGEYEDGPFLSFVDGPCSDAVVTTDSSGNFDCSYSSGLVIQADAADTSSAYVSVRENDPGTFDKDYIVEYSLQPSGALPDIVIGVGSTDLLHVSRQGKLKLLTSSYSSSSSFQSGKDVDYVISGTLYLTLSLHVNLETGLVDLYVNGTLVYSNFYRYLPSDSNTNVIQFKVYSHTDDVSRSVRLDSVGVYERTKFN